MRALTLLLFLLSPSARAEYRVFELIITDSTSGQARTQISTLDPYQFRRYFNVRATEKVTYIDTWMCRGNTGWLKGVCLKPQKPTAGAPPTTRKN